MSMATTAINQDAILNWAAAQISSMATGICESCHKKPKFSTHKYCGKTCAAQAATAQQPVRSAKSRPIAKARVPPAPAAPKPAQLCDYCRQKPKFGSFDHCGKSCASKAAATPPVQPIVQGRSAPKQGAHLPANSQNQTAKGSKPATRHAPLTKDESSEDDDEDDYPDADEEDEDDTGPGTDLDAYPSDDDEEPALVPPIRPVKAAYASIKPSNPTRRVVGVCLIPNCGKSSFVDRSGVKADYCSTKHREEAVSLGLVPGCIMCQRYPQSGMDYFCSTACKNQSMTKT